MGFHYPHPWVRWEPKVGRTGNPTPRDVSKKGMCRLLQQEWSRPQVRLDPGILASFSQPCSAALFLFPPWGEMPAEQQPRGKTSSWWHLGIFRIHLIGPAVGRNSGSLCRHNQCSWICWLPGLDPVPHVELGLGSLPLIAHESRAKDRGSLKDNQGAVPRRENSFIHSTSILVYAKSQRP